MSHVTNLWQGDLSEEELVRALQRMKCAGKLTDKDLAAIWAACPQYEDYVSAP